MVNSYARRMLRDGRNPYGSRGGYVVSRDPRHRRDRGMEDEPYMDSYYERDRGRYNREYEQYPYEEMRGDFEYTRQYHDGNRPYDMRGDYRNYGDDYDDEDYRGRRRNSRGQYMSDRRGRSDYGDDEDFKLSKREIIKWGKNLENADGSRGAHFEEEQIEQMAMQMGIDPKEFGDGVLCMAVNMTYSDYCGVAKKYGVDRLDYYIDSAKAFLKDKDFDGDGAEKLFLYYKCIASRDED